MNTLVLHAMTAHLVSLLPTATRETRWHAHLTLGNIAFEAESIGPDMLFYLAGDRQLSLQANDLLGRFDALRHGLSRSEQDKVDHHLARSVEVALSYMVLIRRGKDGTSPKGNKEWKSLRPKAAYHYPSSPSYTDYS